MKVKRKKKIKRVKKKSRSKMEHEEVYTIDDINKLKNKLFHRAWEKAGGDVSKYEHIKRQIRKRIKFRLIIEPDEMELTNILEKIAGSVKDVE